MRSQITCPACQTPFAADIHQIVDVGQNPGLKEALISGYLNLAQCPNCGAVTQISGPILYHDPEHELFMVHVPVEMGLPLQEQERLIGQMVQRAMDSLPPEERRGYMLQPQTILSMQTFMEKVLETEGITHEMIERQKEQTELLRQMSEIDRDALKQLIKDNQELIDETFFAMLRAMREAADGSGDEEQSLRFTNLQARLYRETETGRRLERQQRALREFSQELRAEGDLTPDLLLKHVLANKHDQAVLASLIAAAQPAFNYQFFLLLSQRIEKREKAGIDTSELTALRETLLAIQDELEEISKAELDRARKTLQSILSAEDKAAGVRRNFSKIDNLTLNLLAATIHQAEQQGDSERLVRLQEVNALITNMIEEQAPPEIRMVNRLIRAENLEERQRILDGSSELVDPELVQLLNVMAEDADNRGQAELSDRIKVVRGLIEARLPG